MINPAPNEPEPADAMRARVRASFDRQQMMATLGVTLTSIDHGRVELDLPYNTQFTQQHGFLHAGTVAAVLDTACGYAAFTVMPPDAAVLMAAYTINLLAPAAGQRFRMVGEVVRAGRTLVVCRGVATAGNGENPVALMQATVAVVQGRADVHH